MSAHTVARRHVMYLAASFFAGVGVLALCYSQAAEPPAPAAAAPAQVSDVQRDNDEVAKAVLACSG